MRSAAEVSLYTGGMCFRAPGQASDLRQATKQNDHATKRNNGREETSAQRE